MGDPAETAARLNIKLWVLVVTDCVGSYCLFSPNPLVE